MKKLLPTLAAGALAMGAYAQSVTLNVDDAQDIKGTFAEEELKDDGSVKTAAHYQPLESFKLGDYTFTFSSTNENASSQPAYYHATSTSKNQQKTVRLYAGTTMTITAPEGVTMYAIDTKGSNGKTTTVGECNNGEWKFTSASATTWTGETNSLSVTVSGSYRITELTIVTTKGGDQPDVPQPGDLGSAEAPVSVAEALAAAQALDESGSIETAYCKGVITAITELSTSFGNATYIIGDANGDATITVFRGYYLEGAKFTSASQLSVGAEVVVKGKLINYKGNTPEFAQGNELISYKYDGEVEPDKTLGTEESPVSVTEALAAATALTADESIATAYTTGTVKAIEEISAQFGNATYTITDGTSDLRVFRGYGLDGVKFTAEDELAVGDVVVIKGALINYNGENPQYNSGSWIIKLNGQSGVEGVNAADNAPAEYFNLQGVRVANPENGLYIRRQGGKATKVYVK